MSIIGAGHASWNQLLGWVGEFVRSTLYRNVLFSRSFRLYPIIEQSSQVKTLVDEVNLGSQEQTRGIEQVAKAISQMEQMTQTTAANAEESAAAAEQEHVCRSFGKCVGAPQSRRAGQAASTVHFLDFGLRRVSRFRLCNHDIWAVVGIQGDGSFWMATQMRLI